jgi:hypothetical protein
LAFEELLLGADYPLTVETQTPSQRRPIIESGFWALIYTSLLQNLSHLFNFFSSPWRLTFILSLPASHFLKLFEGSVNHYYVQQQWVQSIVQFLTMKSNKLMRRTLSYHLCPSTPTSRHSFHSQAHIQS